MALGAGANVQACELEAPYSTPGRGCDTADLFHFEVCNEVPPRGAQDVIYKDPNTTVLGICASAFLPLSGSTVFVLRAKGKRDIPSALGFREGMGSRLHWPWAPPSGNLEVLVPMFFLRTFYYDNRL